MKISSPSRLTDVELAAELRRLAACEREATVALLVHLAEFDARRLYEAAALPSTFEYCRTVLRLSEGASYNRIEAARAARRFPVIVEMLADGRLSVTTARMLARHLTADNHRELLAAAAGMGKRDVEQLLASPFPRAEAAPSIRKLPAPSEYLPAGPETPLSPAASVPGASAPCSPRAESPAADVPSGQAARVRPIAAERYEIRFTASAGTRAKLREAQELLSHAIPSGDIAQVFDRALTVLVEHLRRKKHAATSRPRPRPKDAPVDGGTAGVKRAVWARDGGGCAFIGAGGRRCGSRRWVEFHHVYPRAMGGRFTVDNIQLRCRAHNGHEVDLFFGPGVRRAGAGATGGGHGWREDREWVAGSFRNEFTRPKTIGTMGKTAERGSANAP